VLGNVVVPVIMSTATLPMAHVWGIRQFAGYVYISRHLSILTFIQRGLLAVLN